MPITIENVEMATAHNGSLTAKVTMSNRSPFFLHSRYSPEQEAKDWLKQIDLKPNTAYLVMGFGLGYHVKELLNNLPENSYIYILEHDKTQNTIGIARQYIPKKQSKWMSDERIACFSGEQIRIIAGYIVCDMFKKQIRTITLCKHFPTIQMFTEFYLQLEKELFPKIEQIFWIKYKYSLASGLNCIENTFKNIPYKWSNPGINELCDAFKNVPAIIVSAGPSLNKNIEELKKYTDKAVVLCSGSAIRALHKHNITPHFLATIDPFVATYNDFENKMSEKTALIAYADSYHQVVAEYPGQRFFCNDPDVIVSDYDAFLPPTANLNKNVSVAVLAFEFALHIGADPIIFIGQDMSLTPEASHADGVQGDGPEYLIDADSLDVVGHQGEILKTMPAFKELLDYFVMRITYIENRTIINATEGGAYMNGALHMTLHEAGEKYIVGQEKNNVDAIIQKIVDGFKPKYYEEMCNYLIGMLSNIKIFEAKTKENFIETAGMDEETYIRQFDQYFDYVKQSPIYLYIGYFKTVFQLLLYEQRAGMQFEEEYVIKLRIKNNIVDAVTLLQKYVAESLQLIQNMPKERIRGGDE